MGRFINADAFASTGQGLIGNNMFAYCENNPVNYFDPRGTYMCYYGSKLHFGDSLATSTESEYTTVSIGISGSITLGPFVYGVQIAAVTDSLGYSEIQFTYFSPISTSAITGTPSVDEMLSQVGAIDKASDVLEFSLMGNVSFYNAPLAENLYGVGYQVGGSVGTGPAISVDYNIVPNGTNTPYTGVTISGGFGSTDFHGSMGVTSRVMQSRVSVYDLVNAANNAMWGIY